MQTFLAVVREAWTGTSSCRGLRFTQSDYTAKIMEDALNLGFGPIRVCTTAGQSGTPPDPKMLPAQPCDPGGRELIGSLKFLSRCASFDISFVVQQLAGLVTRWCEWARKETRHIPGFVAHSAEWSLITKSADDDWEELTQHLLRCVLRREMFRRIDTQSSWVKRQFLLDYQSHEAEMRCRGSRNRTEAGEVYVTKNKRSNTSTIHWSARQNSQMILPQTHGAILRAPDGNTCKEGAAVRSTIALGPRSLNLTAAIVMTLPSILQHAGKRTETKEKKTTHPTLIRRSRLPPESSRQSPYYKKVQFADQLRS